jgi:hypothetical protein
MTFNRELFDRCLFERYFYERAQLADEMASTDHVVDAHTLATASLDALAMIWLHDFPNVKKKLDTEMGGAIRASIRLARFLKQFVADDSRVGKVAVVCFAQDWKKNRPQDAYLADKLLIKRIGDSHTFPKSYLDVSRTELAQECPELNSRPDLYALAEEYEYGAILYTFYRCPLVHSATTSPRTHGFVRGEDVGYCPSYDDNDRDKVAIGFGSNLAALWLRKAIRNYVQTCQQAGIVPANHIDAGTEQEKRLRKLWNKLK